LSGGQRQLVSIAQTLAREPDIVLLDEPTSALDLHRQFDVLTLMARLTRERGILTLVSIHDLNQALRFADKVMVLADSTLKALGTPREVVTSQLLADVYRVNARIEGQHASTYVVVEGAL
jgi:iron complex transport system ATP-binding protein